MSCNNPGSTTFNITGSSNTANLIFNSEQGVITEGNYENNNPNLNEYVSSNSLVEINKLSTIGNNFKCNHTSQSSGNVYTVLSHGPGLTFEVNKVLLKVLKNFVQSQVDILPIPEPLIQLAKTFLPFFSEERAGIAESISEQIAELNLEYQSNIEVFYNDKLSTINPEHAKHCTTYTIRDKNVVSTLLLESQVNGATKHEILLGTMDISNNSCELLKVANGNHTVLRTFADMNVNNIRDMKWIEIHCIKYLQLFLVNTCTNNIEANNNNASIYLIKADDLENNPLIKISLKDESDFIKGDLEAMYYDEVNDKYLCSVSVVKPVDLSNVFALDENGENVLDLKQVVTIASTYKQGKVFAFNKNLLNVNASNIDVKLLLGSELELNNVSSYNINSTEDKLFFTTKSTPFETIFSIIVTLIPNTLFAGSLNKSAKKLAVEGRNRFTLAYGIFLFRILVSVSKLFIRFGTEFYSEKNELENIFTSIKTLLHPVENLWNGAANQLQNTTDISNVISDISGGVFNRLFSGINHVYDEVPLDSLKVTFDIGENEDGETQIEAWVMDYSKDPTLNQMSNPFESETAGAVVYNKKTVSKDLFYQLIALYGIELEQYKVEIVLTPVELESGADPSELPTRYCCPYYHESMFARTIFHSTELITQLGEDDEEGMAAFKFEWNKDRKSFKLLLSLDYFDQTDQVEDDGYFIKTYYPSDLNFDSAKEMEAELLSFSFISNMFKNYVPLQDILATQPSDFGDMFFFFSDFAFGASIAESFIFSEIPHVLSKIGELPGGVKIERDIIASRVLNDGPMRQVPYLFYTIGSNDSEDEDAELTKTRYWFFNPNKYWSTAPGLKARIPKSKDSLYEFSDVSNTVLKDMKSKVTHGLRKYKLQTENLSNNEKISLYNVKLVPADLLDFPLTLDTLKLILEDLDLEDNKNISPLLDNIYFTMLNADSTSILIFRDVFEENLLDEAKNELYNFLITLFSGGGGEDGGEGGGEGKQQSGGTLGLNADGDQLPGGNLTNNGYNVYNDVAIGNDANFKTILKDKIRELLMAKMNVNNEDDEKDEYIMEWASEIVDSFFHDGISLKEVLNPTEELPPGMEFLNLLFNEVLGGFEGLQFLLAETGLELPEGEFDVLKDKVIAFLEKLDVVKLGMQALKFIVLYLTSAKNSPQDIYDILSDLVKHINPYRYTTKMLGIDGFNVLSLDKTNLSDALANTELENVFNVLIGNAKNFEHGKFNKENVAFGSGLDNVFNVSAHGVDDVCGNNIIMGTTDMGSLVWNGLGNGIDLVVGTFLNQLAPILAEGDDDPAVKPLIKLFQSVFRNLKVRWGIMPMKLKVLLQSALLNQPKVFPANFSFDRRLHGHDVFVLHNNTVINKVTTSGFDNKLYINQKDLSYRATSLNLLHKDGRSVLCCGTDKATFILNVNV
jgi:hypothetical protein